MDINLKDYEKALEIARSFLKKRGCEFNEYDIVHETLLQFNSLKPADLKRVYFMFVDIPPGGNVNILPESKTCKGCSPSDPLPTAMFYIITHKSRRLVISTLCRSCDIKRSTAFHKKMKHIESHKITCRRSYNAYYQRNKDNKEFIQRRKDLYKERMKNPAYRRKRAKYAEDRRRKLMLEKYNKK